MNWDDLMLEHGKRLAQLTEDKYNEWAHCPRDYKSVAEFTQKWGARYNALQTKCAAEANKMDTEMREKQKVHEVIAGGQDASIYLDRLENRMLQDKKIAEKEKIAKMIDEMTNKNSLKP